MAGVAVPSGFARCGQMVQACTGRIAQQLADGVRRDVGNQIGTCGGAVLVIDDVQFRALLAELQHGFGKVAAARAVDPAGAENQMPGAMLPDCLLAFQLGLAIDVEWRWGVGFAPGALTAAVEDVIGGKVQQRGAKARGFLCQDCHGRGVNGAGCGSVAFRLVDCGKGCGIDDHIRAQLPDGFCQSGGVQEVALQGRTLTDRIAFWLPAQGHQLA